MKLNLKKPLAFFDLETTGTDIATARIVEIGILIVQPDQSTTEHRYLVNPTIPIPLETSMIHGIYDKDVADKPTFAQLAKELYDLLNPCDLGGYNSNRFDVPVLMEEFLRVNINFSIENRNLIDAFTLFAMKEKRDLSAALQFYCKENLENAHTAMADVIATYKVFKAQIERYDDVENDMQWVNDNTRDKSVIDSARRLVKKNNAVYFNFGKYKDRKVADILIQDPGYFNWVMRSNFTLHTKQKLKEIKLSLGL